MTSTGRKKKIAKKNAENTMQEQERPVLDSVGNEFEEFAQDRAKISLASAAQPKIQSVDFSHTQQAVEQNANGLIPDDRGELQQPETYPAAQAVVQNPKGIIPQEPAEGLWDSMLRKKRERYIQDKTDALKMQKYYALADTLNAIGKIGGAAIGGAIGGNIMDSAPAVPEYKENRGYLQAFEQAKRATDRMDKLDDTEFSLAYSKAQRDEQRAYEEKKLAENRKWQEEQTAENRKWQEEQTAKTQAWKEGESEKDRENQRTLRNMSESKNSDYAQKQFDIYHPKLPVEFKDGTSVKMNDIEFKSMFDNFKGQKIGETAITADNFDYLLRQNPDFFRGYLVKHGFLSEGSAKPESEPAATETAKPSVKEMILAKARQKAESRQAVDADVLKTYGGSVVND